MLISDVLYISAIALCVKESLRTEVVHNLKDGHTAVLDLRQIGLPGLAPPHFQFKNHSRDPLSILLLSVEELQRQLPLRFLSSECGVRSHEVTVKQGYHC